MPLKEKDKILLRDPISERGLETQQFLNETYHCIHVATIDDTLAILRRETIHSVIVREDPGIRDGIAFCRAIHKQNLRIKTVLIAHNTDQKQIISAFNENSVFRCLIEPFSREEFTATIRKAVRQFEIELVQDQLIERAAEIDRQIDSLPYLFYRLRISLGSLVRVIAGSTGLCILAIATLLLTGIAIFLLLYYIKSLLGIDLFSDRHLKDFLFPWRS